MQKSVGLVLTTCLMLFAAQTILSQEKEKDSTKKATEELPLEPERSVSFTTDTGTWISLDVSPDGKTIVFDMMGDLFTIPISGGKATQITSGMKYDVPPRYSPDGKADLIMYGPLILQQKKKSRSANTKAMCSFLRIGRQMVITS